MTKHILQYYKVLITLLFLSFSNNSNAQIYLSGNIVDINTSIGVPAHTVFISTDTLTQQGYFFADTIQTDGQGYFIDTLFPPTSYLIKFYISTYDCNQNLITDSVYSVYPAPTLFHICTSGLNMCLADYVAYPDSSNYHLINFYNLSSSNITSCIWSFGDGNFSFLQSPSHVYSNYGTYYVCLNVTDTISNCNQTYCDSLKVSPIMNCTNSFTSTKLTSKKFKFDGSVAGLYPTIFYWDFGDGNTGNGKNITHEYLQPGLYTVKLNTVSLHPQTLDSCLSFSQQTVQANGNPTAGVWGQVFADSLQIDSGMVYIYSYDLNIELTLVDSAKILHNDTNGLGSYYEITGLPYGKYVSYLKLSPSSIFYQSHAPAYSGNTIYWNQAFNFELNKVSTVIPINLTHIYPLNGSSSISGYVYEGSKAISGDPISKVPIYLLDQNKTIVDFTYSHSDGYFIFDSLTIQNYYIYSDVINHSIYPPKIEVSSNNQDITNVEIFISPSSVTSIEKKDELQFKIYPNPTDKILNVNFASQSQGNLEFNIYNIVGQNVMSEGVNNSEFIENSSQQNTYKLDVSSLKTGVYFLQIKIGNKYTHVEKIIISK